MKPRLLIIVFVLGIILSLAALASSSGLFDTEHELTQGDMRLRIFGGEGETTCRKIRDWLRKQVVKHAAIKELGWHDSRSTAFRADNITLIFFDITGAKGSSTLDMYDTKIWSVVPYKGDFKLITRRAYNSSRYYFECSLYFLACVQLEVKAVREGKNHTFRGTLNRPAEEYPGVPAPLSCSGADPYLVEKGKWCEKCEHKSVFFFCECGGSHCLNHWPKLIDLSEHEEPQTTLAMYYFKDFFEWLARR